MAFSRLHDNTPHKPLVCAQFVWIQQRVMCCSVAWWQTFGFARKRCVLLIVRILMQICFVRGTHQLGKRVAFNNVCVKQPSLLLECLCKHSLGFFSCDLLSWGYRGDATSLCQNEINPWVKYWVLLTFDHGCSRDQEQGGVWCRAVILFCVCSPNSAPDLVLSSTPDVLYVSGDRLESEQAS